MRTFDYSYKYNNPAPVAKIVLRDLDDAKESPQIEALIDSGADVTIVPVKLLKGLRLKALRSGYIVSQWKDRIRVDVYRVHLYIGDIKVQAIEVAADPVANDVIVGRNALNKLRVVLDGLGETVEISDYS